MTMEQLYFFMQLILILQLQLYLKKKIEIIQTK